MLKFGTQTPIIASSAGDGATTPQRQQDGVNVKITQKGPDSIKVSRPANGSEARPAAPAPAPAGGSELDRVQLSALATSQLPAGEAPFNAENVERIKQAIRNGEFTVNAEVVADRLLEIESGLSRQP